MSELPTLFDSYIEKSCGYLTNKQENAFESKYEDYWYFDAYNL
jgi:hypothetical protein